MIYSFALKVHDGQVLPQIPPPVTDWKNYKVNAVFLQENEDLREYENSFSDL